MEKEKLIAYAKMIMQKASKNSFAAYTMGLEFLKVYIGENTAFYQNMLKFNWTSTSISVDIQDLFDGLISYIEADLEYGTNQERKIQIETVSDFLAQAQEMLNDIKVHPAIPCGIIGACLEEFLRNWIEFENIEIGTSKRSLDSYSKILRSKDFIDKQDLKDIVSWGGLRNDSAHGHWDKVSNSKKVELMLIGVNLFMRKYSVN